LATYDKKEGAGAATLKTGAKALGQNKKTLGRTPAFFCWRPSFVMFKNFVSTNGVEPGFAAGSPSMERVLLL